MKNFLKILLFIFILIQFLPLGDNYFSLLSLDKEYPYRKITKVDKSLEFQAPDDIKVLLKRSCYDCHSFETKYPWYSFIAPFSWTIDEHINVGRKWVNFSIWNSYTKDEKQKKIKEIYKALYLAMPLKSYTLIHKDAILSKDDRKKLRDYFKNLGDIK